MSKIGRDTAEQSVSTSRYGGFYGVRLARCAPPRPYLRLLRTNPKALEAAAWTPELKPPRDAPPEYGDHVRGERTDAPRRCAWTLTCDSWCRVAGGSGQTHEVTPTETRLLDEGFC